MVIVIINIDFQRKTSLNRWANLFKLSDLINDVSKALTVVTGILLIIKGVLPRT